MLWMRDLTPYWDNIYLSQGEPMYPEVKTKIETWFMSWSTDRAVYLKVDRVQ